MVRIATYNIWNSEEGMPQRENYIIDEIINCNADIVCLQEVHDKVQAEKIALKANYKYLFFIINFIIFHIYTSPLSN